MVHMDGSTVPTLHSNSWEKVTERHCLCAEKIPLSCLTDRLFSGTSLSSEVKRTFPGAVRPCSCSTHHTTKIETTHTEMATTLSAAPSALAIRSLPSFPTTTTTTTTTTIIFDDDDHDDDGKEVKEVKEVREEEEEMHEFVVIYEGPPSPRQGDGDDDDLGKNRQVMCLSLPPTGGGCASTRGGTTSYVSEDDLLASIAARIGWPASFLCISSRGGHISSPSPRISPSSPLLLFPTGTVTTSDRRHHRHPPLRATIVPRLSSVRGGKGGFGTLLRGQSKQADVVLQSLEQPLERALRRRYMDR